MCRDSEESRVTVNSQCQWQQWQQAGRQSAGILSLAFKTAVFSCPQAKSEIGREKRKKERAFLTVQTAKDEKRKRRWWWRRRQKCLILAKYLTALLPVYLLQQQQQRRRQRSRRRRQSKSEKCKVRAIQVSMRERRAQSVEEEKAAAEAMK